MSRSGAMRLTKYRALLTDVLPFEVPLPFSNEGFYRFLSSHEATTCPELVQALLTRTGNDIAIPFDYRIRRRDGTFRKLSVVHPGVQERMAGFYAKHDALILSLCSRSPFSLRFPAYVTSAYCEEELVAADPEDLERAVETAGDGFAPQLSYCSSYFGYDRYALLYRYFDSYEYVRLEKRFRCLRTFDIANCFYTIYTHSLAWAVRDKSFAKTYMMGTRTRSFEAEFDRLMQSANYRETSGIVVGPEMSRIFAELILQRIDLNVLRRLECERGLACGKDYEVRRYIDDYFVYTHREDSLDAIYSTFREELEGFHLRISHAKTVDWAPPFMSPQSMAKSGVREYLSRWLDSLLVTLPDESGAGGPAAPAVARSLRADAGLRAIAGLKTLVKQHGVSFGDVSAYTLRMLKWWLARQLREATFVRICVQQEDRARALLNSFLDVAFFVYAMDTRVASTYKILEIMLTLNRVLATTGNALRSDIQKRMFDEAFQTLERLRRDGKTAHVEILNLLVGLRELDASLRINERQLCDLFAIDLSQSPPAGDLDYFLITTLLYYVRDGASYDRLRCFLVDSAMERIRAEPVPFNRAELVCLWFDMVACPFIERQHRAGFIDLALEKTGGSARAAGKNAIYDCLRRHTWFFNWRADLQLEGLLKKKKLRTYM